MSFKNIAFFALATGLATVANAQVSGTGTTTRYWDCCKPSCAWSGKALVSSPVQQCDKNNNPLAGGDANQSACNGGDSYSCADQTAMVNPENPLQAFGFAAANVGGASEADTCCACYELTFTSTSLATSGKSMIVQVTNTGSDLVQNQFDLAFPGGGVGIFNACSNQYGAFPLGAQYGGITDGSLCDQYPAALQAGCKFRFGWFEGADNPTVSYKAVTCPAALTDKTGCVRQGETPTGPSAPSSTSSAAASSSVAPAPSSSYTATTTSSAAPAPSSSTSQAPAPSSSTSKAPAPSSAQSTYSQPPAPSSSLSTYSQPPAPVYTSTTTKSAGPVNSSSTTSTGSAVPVAPPSSMTTTTVAVTTTSAAVTSTGSFCAVQYVTVYDL